MNSGDKPSWFERKIFWKLSARLSMPSLSAVSFPTAAVSIVVVAFTPSTEVKGVTPFSSLPVLFPAADKLGECTVFPSVTLDVVLPREVNTDAAGAVRLPNCTGGG